MVALDIDHPFGVMWTIGLISGDRRGFGFPCGHPQHRLFKAGNEFPFPQGKLEWVTLQRCVKGGSIGESAGIVDFDHIPNLCLGHEALLWSTNKRYTHGWEDGKSRWNCHGPSRACW